VKWLFLPKSLDARAQKAGIKKAILQWLFLPKSLDARAQKAGIKKAILQWLFLPKSCAYKHTGTCSM
jgi:uncharacterized protein YqcC (DUF446 family)